MTDSPPVGIIGRQKGFTMSRDWTKEELASVSKAMKEAGYMSYEEFCAELEKQGIYPAIADTLQKAYEGSYYTITGVGGDAEEWKTGYADMLREQGIGEITGEWISFTGKDMNETYHLTGDNRYPDDLHFLAFPLDGLDAGKLAMFKLQMQDRWFDDIVDNNARRERVAAGLEEWA